MDFSPRKILLIKPSALGDVVQSLPVATGLKRQWPNAELHWIVSDAYQEVLKDHPAINRVIVYPRNRWKNPFRLPEIIAWAADLRGERYDLVIDLQGLLRSGLMTLATGSQRRLGLKSAREGSRLAYTEIIDDAPVSAAERYLCALRHLQITPQPLDFQLKTPGELPPPLERPGYIVLHPYSRWRTKLWPWRYYQELIDLMPAEKFVVVGEGPWFPLAGSGLVDLRGKLTLRRLMSVLQQAKAVLSTDSGPAHLAAALGATTIVLFGATDWRKTRPVGKSVSVQTHAVSCSPCMSRVCLREETMLCMTGLAPRVIRERIIAIIS
jgi:heptosyltransferase I